ncbi:hypothetical protein [Acinetobacter indicus]|uniref:hypothetical protein n=1 Tax=Acinetobacter indicus TaxID=756892 RepID=UPI000948E88F|nr:hypothetical protein [Acinetobacter indicus]
MNLIEQLGGYERAKHEFEMIKEMKPIYPGEIETNNRLLLEYRRQHNIFESGDLVVDTTGFYDWLCRVEYLSTDGRVVMYRHDQRKGDTAFTTRPLIETVRHATDAEIKAGKRLEVK